MNLVTSQLLEQCLFTTSPPNSNVHLCAVAIEKTYAVALRHHQHSSLEQGQKLQLYSVVGNIQIEVFVSIICDRHDFIIFETTGAHFPVVPCGAYPMYCGQAYFQLGINDERQPKWKDGTVSATYRARYIGTSHGALGDSGSGLFDATGRFIGISVAKQNFLLSNDINTSITNAAEHHPHTMLISAEIVRGYLPFDRHDFGHL